MKEHIIDATNQSLGRTASKAAVLLMGKNSPEFARNIVAKVKVKITNASKIKVTEKKLLTKEYKNYSGYPGGLRIQTMKKVTGDKGFSEVMKKAVRGMIPSNKLRPLIMKNLIVTE